MQVGEITAAAARDKDFFADLAAALDDQNTPSTFARLDGAHQTGSAAADDDYIITSHYEMTGAATKRILRPQIAAALDHW